MKGELYKRFEEAAKNALTSLNDNCYIHTNEVTECSYVDGYIKGATEQKAIDDAELEKLKTAWEREAATTHNDLKNYQQGYHDAIDKACKAFKHFMLVQYGELIDESMEMYWKESITKAMEK